MTNTSLPTCGMCRLPISGEYIIALDAHWHPDHFLCGRCRKRIGVGNFVEERGKPYHPACAAESFAEKCGCCGQPCVGHYTKDESNIPYCPACWKKTKTCFLCGRTICPGSVCKVCASSAVVAKAEAANQFAFVHSWLKRQGVPIRHSAGSIHLKLVQAETLSSRFSAGGLRHVGETAVRWVEILKVRHHHVSVTMVVPMPQVLFRGVAAHELGHVWMMTTGITTLSQPETEGFCELLAYLYYQSEGSTEAKRHANRMLEASDPVYGQGFQRVHRLYERQGLAQIVKSLAGSGRMPR